jgi:hypothetical protein
MQRLAYMAILAFVAAGTATAGDFEVSTATYLGGPEAIEEWTAVDIAPDGRVVVAGSAPTYRPEGIKEAWLLAGGDGIVMRLDAKTGRVVSAARIGDYIEDMETGADGRIALTGSFGTAVLTPDAAKVLWRDGSIIRGTRAAQFRNQTPPFKRYRYTRRVARVAVGGDGTVASLQSEQKVWGEQEPKKGRLYVWDAKGKRLCDMALAKCKYPKDLCVDARNKLVIVGGFNTYTADSRHMKNHPIHMPFLTAYSYDGKVKWAAYDFPAKDIYAQNTYADSRVQRLVIGRDGYLYMGGYIHGGDYVWKHHPLDVTKRVKIDTGYDSFSVAANMGRGIDQSYFAKFDPATGNILQGQVLLCRRTARGGGKPTQIQIRGIHADRKGNLYLSGYCEKYIRDRDAQKVAGRQVREYHKPEIFLLAVTPDFRTRKVWTVFSGGKCEAACWGLSVRDGRAALLGEVYEGSVITTDNALQKRPAGHIDGYLVLWETK